MKGIKHAYLLYTGYGKTKLCLDMIMNAKVKPKTLLISTKNVIETAWSSEINKWYNGKLIYNYITGSIKPEDRFDILEKDTDILGINTAMLDWYIKNTTKVTSKRKTKQGVKEYHSGAELIDRFDLIILDEVSLFKSYSSNRFKLIKKWAHKTDNVIALSATPTPKNIEDMWAIAYLIDGGERLGKNITEFRRNYAIPVAMSNGFNRYEYTKASTNFVLDLVKDITTSIPAPPTPLFPEPTLKKVIIKPDSKTAKILKDFKEDNIITIDGINLLAFSKIQLINKVNQIASGNIYTQDIVLNINKIKLNVLKYKLTQIQTPVLISYTYVFDKEKLLELPGARLLNSPKDFKDWNDNKVPVGIISPYSAAHGLNLQDSNCKNIIWFSPIWDTEKWIQLNARVCRRGQKNKVLIEVLLMKGSYDEHAFNICQDKFIAQYNNLVRLQ